MKTYEKTFRSKEARGGERTVWELAWPGECKLTKLIIKQVGAEEATFTIDIFNKRIAAVTSSSSGGADAEGDYTADPDNHRVVATISSDSPGKLVKYFTSDEGHFVNQDVLSDTNRARKIYLEIEPAGSGDKTWDVTLACQVDIG